MRSSVLVWIVAACALLPNLVSLPAGRCAAWAAESTSPLEAEHPNRLKRSESFLGIHFDFHAGPDGKEIGKNTTREMIEAILDQGFSS
jgi:hypothetical protein